MRWIKVAIGAVIAISLIQLVVLSVINISKSLERTEEITITTELEYVNKYFSSYFYTNVYQFKHTIHFDDLNDYFEKGYTITNLYDYTNDINITIIDYDYFNVGTVVHLQIIDNNSVSYIFYDNGVTNGMNIYTTYDSVYNVSATDIALMDIIFTRTNINLVATLLPFISVIFAGGVVLYIYKSFKKD